jgi:hypothetical protein
MHKYELAICEIVHPLLHGINEINNHFLIYMSFDVNEFYTNGYKQEERRIQRHRQRCERALQLSQKHPTIRQYNQHYVRLELIQYIHVTVNGNEYHVGVLKTFWLRIVQRRWKKIFKSRQEITKKRSSVTALYEKQLTGMWPKGLRICPRFTLQ